MNSRLNGQVAASSLASEVSTGRHLFLVEDPVLPYRLKLTFRMLKRLVDIVVSIIAIVCMVPFGLIVALVICRVDPKAPPIYRQLRVGRDGDEFWIFKFRTMYADAHDVEKYFSPAQLVQWKTERKVDDDPRILPVIGHFLRNTSLDELPQFVNVLLGHLSVVGPRAVTIDELTHYGDQVNKLLSVRPGITGPWQVGDRNNATFASGVRQNIDLAYVKNAGPKMDTVVFFKTFSTMFWRRTGR